LLADDKDLTVSTQAHVILPIHREIDRVRETSKAAIGTTKRGIGPAYESKMARRGVRMADLASEARLRPLIERSRDEMMPWLKANGGKLPSVDATVAEYLEHGEKLKRYFGEASRLVYDEIKRGRHVLFEGAQGALLDVDRGTYPFVTSSSTIAG